MPGNNITEVTPLTLEELKEPLTPAERQEMDNPFFICQVNMYIEGLNSIQDLSQSQRYAMIEQMRDHVRRRVEVNQTILENPDVANMEINPVFIIGLPRSGTTMLHRLLSNDPKFVAPMAWEMLQPCPPGRPQKWKGTERYEKAKEYYSHIYPTGVESMKHIHEMNLDMADECYLILQHAMLDNGWSMCANFKKLRDFTWTLPQDVETEVYEYYKRALKCIFYNTLRNGEVPLLKAPFHLFYIHTIKKVFPNATFIFPYRNAKEMYGSTLSIFANSGKVTGFEVTKEYITEFTKTYFKLCTPRVMNAMKTMPQDRLYAVSYSKMVKDPLAAVKEIYANFGWEVTPEMMENMQRHMAENKQHKHGKHTYSYEEFGITDEQIKEIMSEFLEYFGNRENLF